MFNFLKRFRLVYSTYNFFHRSKLEHNVGAYKKLDLKKKYYSSISSKDFEGLDNGKASEHLAVPDFSSLTLSKNDEQSLIDFEKNGFAVIRKFFSDVQVDQANEEINKLVQEKAVKMNDQNKIMFAVKKSALLKSLAEDSRLIQILSQLLDTKPQLFQSINFFKGSEQDTHSDSIHMTTYPLGQLIAVWIALEDIGEDNGPLHYYPGSHHLPYYLNSDYDNEGNRWMIGPQSYDAYEEMIRQKITESGIEKKIFTAKKGDILIWHANLCHGGEPHINKLRTRKSMVLHYFGEGAVCYHEITQRPALMG